MVAQTRRLRYDFYESFFSKNCGLIGAQTNTSTPPVC